MLKLLAFLALPILAIAQNFKGSAYGYLTLDNGQIYTSRSYFPGSDLVDMFKPEGFFIMPDKIDVRGSSYLVSDNELYTAHTDGWFFKNEQYLESKRIKKSGGSFFITSDQSVHIIRTDGSIWETTEEIAPYISDAKIIGGIFFITRDNQIVVTNPYDGKLYRSVDVFKEKRKDIEHIGHNWFTTDTGHIYTIGFINGVAIVKKRRNPRLYKSIKIAGGNYFFDNFNNIHTVNTQGEIDLGQANRTFKVIISNINKDRSKEEPAHMGSNYFIYNDGEVYMVDERGYFFYLKTLPYYERVGQTNFTSFQ